MGDIADDLIDRMFDMEDDGYSQSPCSTYGYRRPRKPKKPAPAGAFDEQTRAMEFPGKKTDPSLLRDYPEKTFDMGFFPILPVNKAPDPWNPSGEEAPF